MEQGPAGSSMPRRVAVGGDRPGDVVSPELVQLAVKLSEASSGLSFIYDTLDAIAASYRLADAVLVVENTPVDRQAFRLRRARMAPGSSRRWLRDVLRSPAGLYTRPRMLDPALGAYVTSLATTALRMDLLGHDASHDPLTGLLNRRSYQRALTETAARSRRYGWPFALMLIDLDNFKAVNDRFGHAAGDETLESLGHEIRSVLRTGDVAARLGGDEFALVLANTEWPALSGSFVERLRGAIASAASTATISFSSGMACFPVDTDDVADLQRIADQRLYADKVSVV